MESDAPPPPPPPMSRDDQPSPPSGTHHESERESNTAVVDRAPPGYLPVFKVLLHNDDVNSPVHVVQSLVELTPLNPDRATVVMKEANDTGLALVLVTHRERAELYQEQLVSKSLTVTIEPA